MICAIDCETTGLMPYYHEVIDICILPLSDDFVPLEHVAPFIVEIQPEFPDRAEKKALQVNGHTLDALMSRTITREIATNMFVEWFNKTMPRGQTIEPLAQNWFFDYSFLTATFKGLNLRKFFFYRARDSQRVLEFVNDRARLHGAPIPFQSTSLEKVANQLEIENPNPHRATNDCLVCAAVYRTLCSR